MMPCMSVPAASMRQPSITTSWVAAQKATRKAPTPRSASWSFGSAKAISTSARAVAICVVTIQARLRPRRAARNGTSTRSIEGAQRNFSE